MRFAGIAKNSTVDYPGKIVTTLFTGGCNFRCEYCHNSGLINIKDISEWIEESEIFEYLDKRRKVLDGICITGGEPSLHSDELIEFVKKVKERYGYDFLIKIDTNGSNPEFIEKIIRYVDYIAVDYKAADYSQFSKCSVETIKKSIGLLNKYGKYEVRITVYPGYIKYEDFKQIAADLKGVRKVAIQQFRKENTAVESSFVPYENRVLEELKKLLEQEGIEVEIRK